MALTYVIVETDCQPMDGEFIDHDKAMSWSIYASPGSRILAFDLAQPIVIQMQEVTKEIVEEAYQAGIYDCDDAAIERARDNLPGQFRGESFVRDILRGKTGMPSAENLEALATELETTADYLLGKSDKIELTNLRPISSQGIPYRGEVAAGLWLEIGEGVQEPYEWLPINPLPQFPDGSVYCLTVRGDSLNKIANPGDTLVCVDLYQSGISIKDGDLVIVERAKQQDGLLEMTAKRVRTKKGGFELYPESTNAKWLPVTFPHSEEDNGETIRILARVEFILRRP